MIDWLYWVVVEKLRFSDEQFWKMSYKKACFLVKQYADEYVQTNIRPTKDTEMSEISSMKDIIGWC